MTQDSIWAVIDAAGEAQTPDARARLRVIASPKIELMLVAGMLAAPEISPGHYGTLDNPIAQAARRWFAPCAGHPAVSTLRKLFYVENGGFACDAVTSFILHRMDPPGLEARHPHSASALRCANGEDGPLDLLVDQLRDFYHASGFASFWEYHSQAYRDAAARIAGFVQAGWAGEDVVATMEDYFGQSKAGYILVPTPLERPGGGSMDMLGAQHDWITSCFDCTVDADWILYLLYHEAGHSFVNPLADKHADVVQRYEGLYPQIAQAMQPWGYRSWQIALNEHILRAQNCRLRRILLGDQAAEALLSREESQGFRYIRALDAKLAEYEAQRGRYPSLDDFYPTLLTALDPWLAGG